VSRVYLLVLGRGRVRLFRRSRAAIRDGIIKGTRIEWSINVRAHAYCQGDCTPPMVSGRNRELGWNASASKSGRFHSRLLPRLL